MKAMIASAQEKTSDGAAHGGADAGSGDVRERILDCAERLFAENGVAETSVRAITAAAGVNVAAVSYYFGSKAGLFTEVLERRLVPLGEERLQLLGRCLEEAGDRPADVDALLRAFVGPSIRLGFRYPYFARFASRLRLDSDRSFWEDYRVRQHGVVMKFHHAIVAALPQLPESEARVRIHYILGAIQHVWSHCPLPPEETPERRLAGFIAFYGAGLRAPAPSNEERG